MIRKGRRWFVVPNEPRFRAGRVVRLRSSRRDPGFYITVRDVEQDPSGWRVTFSAGDCTEHVRLLAWSGDASGGGDAARGYTEEWFKSMQDEPEGVDDWWLRKFGERARAA